mgnify:FL=1
MNFEEMLRLIDKVSASSLSSFEYETEELKLSIQCGEKAVLTATPAVSEAEPRETVSGKKEELPEGKLVKSPLVGTFYAAPSQDAATYVKVGDPVKKGQVLAIVEAMKLMNEIESDFDGTVAEVYVKNGESVEYGMPLFRIV